MAQLTIQERAAMIETIGQIAKPCDAMQVVRKFNKDNRLSQDWHEASNLLDMLHTKGILKVTGYGPDGFTQYDFNKEG